LFDADCLDVMASLPSESIDCFFADPPFNLGKDYGERVHDAHPEDRYLEWCYKWLDEGVRLLKPGGSFFLFHLPRWAIPLGDRLGGSLTFRHWIAVSMKSRLPIAGRLYPAHYALLYWFPADIRCRRFVGARTGPWSHRFKRLIQPLIEMRVDPCGAPPGH
jgi:site-specific DNA-methyltransferase (adenine-specific)